MTDENETYEDDIDPHYAAAMFACSYYQGVGSCSGGCYEEPSCHVDRPEAGWEKYLPADFDMEAFRSEVERRRKVVELERWLAAEKRWIERPTLVEMTETGVYPINPRSPLYATGTRFAAYAVSDGGSRTSWHDTEEGAYAAIEEDRQFFERFWEDKVTWKEQGDRSTDRPWGAQAAKIRPFRDVLRVNGAHHTVGHMGVRGGPRDGLGFGGAVFRWRWLDDPEGTVHESNNVWFQGNIPPEFRDRLPDNAVWIKETR